MFSGKLAESITTIKLFQQKGFLHCTLKRSDLIINFLRVLQRNRYIYGFRKIDSQIIVYLRYYRGTPLIKKILPGSTPGAKQSVNKLMLKSIQKDFLALPIVSTSSGGSMAHVSTLTYPKRVPSYGELICTI
jgi:ribosomal protein S8